MLKGLFRQEIFLLKLLIAPVISRNLKYIKGCTGIRQILIQMQTLSHFRCRGSGRYRQLNRKGGKVDKLKIVDESWEITPVSQDLLKNNSLTRFDPPDNKVSRPRVHTKEKTEDSMIKGINRFSFIFILTFLFLLSSCNSKIVYTNPRL